jgi:uncharacterized DUF497 family protein
LESEWDPAKDVVNAQKHGSAFEDARNVFQDPHLLIGDARRPEHGELRSKAIGRVELAIVTVIFPNRDGVRRIISARSARRDERGRYRASAETA